MSTLFPNATLRDRAPYRFDIVGSFLRPENLKHVRSQFACGECSAEELHKVEHEEVNQLIAKESANPAAPAKHISRVVAGGYITKNL